MLFAGALAMPGPHRILLEGDADIGKSALWDAGIADAAVRGMRVLVTRPALQPSLRIMSPLAETGNGEYGARDGVVGPGPTPRSPPDRHDVALME
jgi:hypothetical protein